MIYTTYFAKVKDLPEHIIPIAICGKAPDWWSGLQYKKLAPKYSFFSIWKETKDNDYYIKHFSEEVLDKLDVYEVVDQLYEMADGKDIALCCYESPNKFCHRHLVADWLTKNGYSCKEYQ